MSGMWLYPYFLLVLSFMGMTSNMASIFVFAKQRFRRSFHRLLVILAIYDFMVRFFRSLTLICFCFVFVLFLLVFACFVFLFGFIIIFGKTKEVHGILVILAIYDFMVRFFRFSLFDKFISVQ